MSNVIDTISTFTFLIFLSFPFIISLHNRTKIKERYIDNGVHTTGTLISSRIRRSELGTLFAGADIETIQFETEVNGQKTVIKSRPRHSDIIWRYSRSRGEKVDVYYLPDNPKKFISPAQTGEFRYWTISQMMQVAIIVALYITQISIWHYTLR